MKARECRNAREFGDIFRDEVASRGHGWTWKKDLRPWLGQMLSGVKFGDASHDWSTEAAQELGRLFIEDASTW